jgi:FtsH-binding integral membrane protein
MLEKHIREMEIDSMMKQIYLWMAIFLIVEAILLLVVGAVYPTLMGLLIITAVIDLVIWGVLLMAEKKKNKKDGDSL